MNKKQLVYERLLAINITPNQYASGWVVKVKYSRLNEGYTISHTFNSIDKVYKYIDSIVLYNKYE